MILFLSIVVVIILILVGTVTYGMYQHIFAYPMSKRKDTDIVSEETYGKYTEAMKVVVKEMNSFPYETVYTKARDGIQLKGYLYNICEGAPIVIFFHGYKATYKWDGYGCFKYCMQNRLNLLMVDQRAHAESTTKTICFGLKERYDCQVWAEYIAERFGDSTPIILSGVSMGSATVMMASDLTLPNSVKGVIADCGYTSPREIIVSTGKDSGMPAGLLQPFVYLALRIASGCKLDDSTAMESVQRTKLPILFIHGEEDDFVPYEMGKRLFEACKSKKYMLSIPKAGHAVGAMENYELYEEKVSEFISEIL